MLKRACITRVEQHVLDPHALTDEEFVGRLDDRFEKHDLARRWKLTIRYTEAWIRSRAEIDEGMREALLTESSPVETTEPAAAVIAAIAFSKTAIAFGAPRQYADHGSADSYSHGQDSFFCL